MVIVSNGAGLQGCLEDEGLEDLVMFQLWEWERRKDEEAQASSMKRSFGPEGKQQRRSL